MCRKLKSNKGESIGEVLAALIIVCLAFLMLCGGVVASANVNKDSTDLNKEFTTEGQNTLSSLSITVSHDSSVDVTDGLGTQRSVVTGYEAHDIKTGEKIYYYYDATLPKTGE